MKPLTDRIIAELQFAGGQATEIADRMDEDVAKVVSALCNLRLQKRIECRVLDVARRVYFYFIPSGVSPPVARHSKAAAARKARVAGHVYFRQMARW